MKKLFRAFGAGLFSGGVFFLFFPYVFVRLSEEFSLPSFSSSLTVGVGASLIILACAWWGYCSLYLSRKGAGTPAPVAPTTRLVMSGPYARSRNPMYFSYFAIFIGLALATGVLLVYAYSLFMIGFIFWYVPAVEEKRMLDRFGSDYRSYQRLVPRWL